MKRILLMVILLLLITSCAQKQGIRIIDDSQASKEIPQENAPNQEEQLPLDNLQFPGTNQNNNTKNLN